MDFSEQQNNFQCLNGTCTLTSFLSCLQCDLSISEWHQKDSLGNEALYYTPAVPQHYAEKSRSGMGI